MQINNIIDNINKELLYNKIKTYKNFNDLYNSNVIMNSVSELTIYSISGLNKQIEILYIGKYNDNRYYGLPIYNNQLNYNLSLCFEVLENKNNIINANYLGVSAFPKLQNYNKERSFYNNEIQNNVKLISLPNFNYEILYRNMINEN